MVPEQGSCSVSRAAHTPQSYRSAALIRHQETIISDLAIYIEQRSRRDPDYAEDMENHAEDVRLSTLRACAQAVGEQLRIQLLTAYTDHTASIHQWHGKATMLVPTAPVPRWR